MTVEHSFTGEELNVSSRARPGVVQRAILDTIARTPLHEDLVQDLLVAAQAMTDMNGHLCVETAVRFVEDVYQMSGSLGPNLQKRVLNIRWTCKNESQQVTVHCRWTSSGVFYLSPCSAAIAGRLHEAVVDAVQALKENADALLLNLPNLEKLQILEPLHSILPVSASLSYELCIYSSSSDFVQALSRYVSVANSNCIKRALPLYWETTLPGSDDKTFSSATPPASVQGSRKVRLEMVGQVRQIGLTASIVFNCYTEMAQCKVSIMVDYSSCINRFRSDAAVFVQMTLARLLAQCEPATRSLSGTRELNLYWDIEGYDLLRLLFDYLWLRLDDLQWRLGTSFNQIEIMRIFDTTNKPVLWASFRCTLDPASSSHFIVVAEYGCYSSSDRLAQESFDEMTQFVFEAFNWLENRLIHHERKVYRGTLQWWFNLNAVSSTSPMKPPALRSTSPGVLPTDAAWLELSSAQSAESILHWPTPQDYNEAVQNPEIVFTDSELRTGRPEYAHLGLPRVRTGMFASVYKLRCDSRNWAVRLFHSLVKDQHHRYQQLSKFIIGDSLPYTVGFEYIEQGISVNGSLYPMLKMEWVSGAPLDVVVADNINNRRALEKLRDNFRGMISALAVAGIAHTDLQHGNVLVSSALELFLVDYDNMYVPALAGCKSNELGHPNYQHPKRSRDYFGPDLDNFSAWVIDTSLSCIIEDSQLWEQAKGGDECLLFRRTDFLSPLQSPILSTMWSHQNQSIRAAATKLEELINMDPNTIPSLA